MSIETQNTSTTDGGGFRKPPSTIFDVLGVLARRWWLILLLSIVGVVVAFGYTIYQGKVFEALATTLVQRQSLAKSLNNIVDPGAQVNEGPRVLEAQAKLARSPEVAEATLKVVPNTGLDVNELLESMEVTPDVNGDLLDFAMHDSDGNTAVAVVNAYVDQYVIYSTKISKQLAIEAAATVRKQMRSLDRAGDKETQGYQQLSRNLDSLRSITSLSTPTAQVIAKATGYEKIKPKLKIVLLLGLVLGLAIGLGAAFILDALDGRVRTPGAIAEYLGLPLLAVLPSGGRTIRPGGRIDDAGVEACRVLLAAIEAKTKGGGSLLVTGVSNPSTYSSVAANLAHASARAGRDTALLDLGFRNASLTRQMGVKGHLGASDILLGGVPFSEASLSLTPGSKGEASVLAGRLRMVPIGADSADASDLIGSRAVKDLIDRLTAGDTLVIVDAGATLTESEAITAAGFVDHVLFVAATDDAKHSSLDEGRVQLEIAAAKPIGLAVIEVSG